MANLTNVKVTDMSKGEVTGIQFEGRTYEKIAEGDVAKESNVGDIVMSKRGRLDVAAGDYFSVVKKGNPLVATNTVIDRAESSHSLVLTDAVLFRKVGEKFEVGDYAKVVGNWESGSDVSPHGFELGQIVAVKRDTHLTAPSFRCVSLINEEYEWSVATSDLVKATEEEISKATANFGKGDIVLVDDGWDRYYGEVISNKDNAGDYLISNGEVEEYFMETELTMIAPKANRVD
jgi:hypothetical protein